MTYHYTMCGLDYVYLLNGYTEHETNYGPGISIEKADELESVLAYFVITDLARLEGQEVRFLRSMMDMSQANLALHLGVQRGTVARWETKPKTAIPGSPDRLLRVLANQKIFKGSFSETVGDLLPEISGKRSGSLNMCYVPHMKEAEPELFNESEDEGWKYKLAA